MTPAFLAVAHRHFLPCLAAALMLLATLSTSPPARAADEDVRSYVTGVAQDVMQLSAQSGAEQLQNQLVRLLDRYADIRTLALFSLGPYRKDLPADKRARYFDLVQAYAASMIGYYIQDFSGARFRILSTSRAGRFITVTSEIAYTSGRVAPVMWRVSTSEGGFRVADVNVHGVWLSIQMRTSFTQVLEKSDGDFGRLISYLQRS